MLKSLFHSVISSVTTRVDDQLKTVTELKKKSRVYSEEYRKSSIQWRLNSKTLRVKLAPIKRILMNKVLRWNILKTRAGGTIVV